MPALIDIVRAGLEAVADPARAPAMQAYMKSAMPYHGVPTPVSRRLFKQLFAAHALTSAAGWRRDVLALWRAARFREERYAAIALSGDRRARGWQTLDTLPMYRELIVDGAWWDYVDVVASHRIGPLLLAFPARMRTQLVTWSRGRDVWLRRTSIICQLAAGERTDLALMYECIEPSLGRPEFFLRKAIGWALRQVAWRDPQEIVRYVRARRGELSPLSKREALKNVLKQGLIEEVP